LDFIAGIVLKEVISTELEEIAADLGSEYDFNVKYAERVRYYSSTIWNWMCSRWKTAIERLGMSFNVHFLLIKNLNFN